MNAFAFDTLRFAKRLQAAGLDQAQSEAFSEALSEAVRDSIVTKGDLDEAVARLREEIKEGQITIIKWLIPLMLGQTAATVALVKLL